jgi:hypothetical protein
MGGLFVYNMAKDYLNCEGSHLTTQEAMFNCIFVIILSQVLCLLGILRILQYKIFSVTLNTLLYVSILLGN